MPSEAEFQEGLDNLEKCGWECDYVITHVAPEKTARRIADTVPGDSLTVWLQQVAERLRFKKWYFGHYHMDREIDGTFRVLYQDIIPLGGQDPFTWKA